ncbi:MAG: hypothetical protein RL367_1977, partial [Pseudomonadota bacterium]
MARGFSTAATAPSTSARRTSPPGWTSAWGKRLRISSPSSLNDRRHRPAVLYGRIGAATQSYGTLTAWLIALVNIVAGQIDRAGGLVFPTPAVDTVEAFGPGTIGRYHSRVSGHREVLGEFPAASMAEEIETP